MKRYLSLSTLRTAALLIASLVGVGSAEAASIRYAVKVNNYSSAGWIQIRPELRSLLGGRVAYLPQYGGWVTDRAQRGEQVRITIAPERGEYQGMIAKLGLRINGRERITPYHAPLTVVGYQVVSTNPADDNIVVWAETSVTRTDERLPIGPR